MTDRIQELRAECAEAAPHLWGATQRAVLDIAREALDGWEKAEQVAADYRKDYDNVVDSLRQAEAELTRLREAAQKVYIIGNEPQREGELAGQVGYRWVEAVHQLIDVALSQENPR